MTITSSLYLIIFLIIISSLFIIISKNPIHSVLFLILIFLLTSFLFILIGAEFVALPILIVYVGAISILFPL